MARRSKTRSKKSSSRLTAQNMVEKAVDVVTGKGKKGEQKKRRSHGVQWYANAVLKAKLKKKLMRIKYGSV